MYHPLPYSKLRSFAKGPLELIRLNAAEREIFDALIAQQDQRGDPGHVSTVVYFTQQLGRLMGLNSLEQEAVNIAAIVHDAGWVLIPQINEIWSTLATDAHSDDLVRVRIAKEKMAELRNIHEQEAVRLVRELIPSHPMMEQVAVAVGDHDTRKNKPPEIFKAFYDADWMWRSTVFSRLAKSSGVYDSQSAEAVFARLKVEGTQSDFLIPWAYVIFRIEVANTILALQKLQSWQTLPTEFMVDYEAEISEIDSANRGE